MRIGWFGLIGMVTLMTGCPEAEYTIGGSVEGLTPGIKSEFKLILNDQDGITPVGNGKYTFKKKLREEEAYKVTIGTQPQGSWCEVKAGEGTVTGNVSDIAIHCTPCLVFTNYYAASAVLGQKDFYLNGVHENPDRWTLNGPLGSPVFVHKDLYVPDTDSNRILGFESLFDSLIKDDSFQSGLDANFVLGQEDFEVTLGGGGDSKVNKPRGGSSNGTWLAMADTDNHRVLLYDVLSGDPPAMPTRAIGQPGLDSSGSGCAATLLGSPEDVAISGEKLVVADSGNHRVLIWNALPSLPDVPPDVVLGQSSFTSCVSNDSRGSPTASTLSHPAGVWTDGNLLLVADRDNHRVLLWKEFPTTSGEPADIVLGQPDATSRRSATTPEGMSQPSAVRSTGQQIFVADYANNRVTIWNRLPTAHGARPDVVLGQPDFTSRSEPSPETPTNRQSLYKPGGLLLAAPYLIVSDQGNHRVLFFNSGRGDQGAFCAR